jgi:hypothetical protein
MGNGGRPRTDSSAALTSAATDSWITGLNGAAENIIRGIDPRAAWPQAVQKITRRPDTGYL